MNPSTSYTRLSMNIHFHICVNSWQNIHVHVSDPSEMEVRKVNVIFTANPHITLFFF